MSAVSVLAVDLGASNGRCMLGAFDGRSVSLETLHRFENRPAYIGKTLCWDLPYIVNEVKAGIAVCGRARPLQSLSVDTWGVDYALLTENGRLLSNPVHYRDHRTDGMLERAFSTMPKDELYRITGMDFMFYNTLYQLLAERDDPCNLLEHARHLLFMPDLLRYFLTGELGQEYTIAATSQLMDVSSRGWSDDLIARFKLPRRLFGRTQAPGQLCGALSADVAEEIGIAPVPWALCASHDTASAALAVPYERGDAAFISCGTWSLVGYESRHPLDPAQAMGFGVNHYMGAFGTVLPQKSVMGLWILQQCREHWAAHGQRFEYAELAQMAAAAPPFSAFIDPDDLRFAYPGDMPARIAQYLDETGQPPIDDPGTIARLVLESLALKYRFVLESLAGKRGAPFGALHIVGGGVQNELLCQLTADITGLHVIAGPIEAAALGNTTMQLHALGHILGLGQIRDLVRRSYDTAAYSPSARERGGEAYGRFLTILSHKQEGLR